MFKHPYLPHQNPVAKLLHRLGYLWVLVRLLPNTPPCAFPNTHGEFGERCGVAFSGVYDVVMEDCEIGDDLGSSPWAIKYKSHQSYVGTLRNHTYRRLRIGRIASNTYQQPHAGYFMSIEDPGYPPFSNYVHPSLIDPSTSVMPIANSNPSRFSPEALEMNSTRRLVACTHILTNLLLFPTRLP
eukprot:m.68332 g.68332  ORF g.68332 m.68332 type:complete len:184 (-) comp18306_c0_seq4:357-908(-)